MDNEHWVVLLLCNILANLRYHPQIGSLKVTNKTKTINKIIRTLL